MPITPLLDLLVGLRRERDEQINAIEKSITYTSERIISSRQHLKESHAALSRAEEQIGRLGPPKVK